MTGLRHLTDWLKHEVDQTFGIRSSAWTFETSGSDSIGVLFVSGGTGHIILNDPQSKQHVFNYSGGGVGLSAGVPKRIGQILSRLPTFLRWAGILKRLDPKRIDPKDLAGKGNVTDAPEAMWNTGLVLVAAGCDSPELTEQDFKGVCVYIDLGISIVEGVSAELMLMGFNPTAINLASDFTLQSEIAFFRLLRPHAVLLSCGRNRGLQANAGVSVSVGYMA